MLRILGVLLCLATAFGCGLVFVAVVSFPQSSAWVEVCGWMSGPGCLVWVAVAADVATGTRNRRAI